LFAPFCSPGVDDRTAGFGAHPLPETMAPFSFDITWLKCSFTHYLNLLFISLVGIVGFITDTTNGHSKRATGCECR
jgi:hypothetical protein